MWLPLVSRLVISIAVVAAVGGTTAIKQQLFALFLLSESVLSLIEGWFSRGAGSSQRGVMPPSEQIPFILAWKKYLLARLFYQMVVLGWFAWVARATFVRVSAWTLAGGTLALAGIALRAASMSLLAERFRSFEVRREDRGVETSGPYAWIRHPGYLALALIDLAAPLLLNVPAAVVLVVLPLTIMLRRITLEEQLLAATYPDRYPAYIARTSRLLPRIY